MKNDISLIIEILKRPHEHPTDVVRWAMDAILDVTENKNSQKHASGSDSYAVC